LTTYQPAGGPSSATVPDLPRDVARLRCANEIACDPQFLEGDRRSSRSTQTIAPKMHVLKAMRDNVQESRHATRRDRGNSGWV
jgi:hypothetical protein